MKNFKKIVTVMPILFLIGITICNAQNVECSDLIKHRSEVLSKYLNKKRSYKVKDIHINTIRNIKNELIEDNSFAVSGYMTSILTIKTLNDLTSSAIDVYMMLNPKNIPILYKVILKTMEGAEFGIGLKKVGNIDWVFIAKETSKKLGTIITKFINLQENLENFKGQQDLKRELLLQLSNIERDIEQYNSDLINISKSKKELKNYLDLTDIYLKENCKYEVKENPIDIESILWKTKKSNINIEDYNYNISEMLSNPELAQYFDFNEQFMNELTQLISRIDYNSEVSIDNYIKQLDHLMKKYIKQPNANTNSKAIETKVIHQKKRKVSTTRNVSSYANFKKSKTSNSNSSGIKKAKVNRSNNNFKPKSCGHSSSWHKKNGTCASKQ